MSGHIVRYRKVRGILAGVLLFVFVLVSAGVAYEQIAEAVIAHKHHYRGGLYDVGERKMHLDCAGQGQVTIVFDSGLGGYGNSWADVQEEVAKVGRACTFDRAGYGWSDSGPLPRDSRSETADLHTLLINAGEHGPLVLVGHSLGGLNSQLYTLEFPGEVVGIVLVDSAHPEQWERLPPSPWDQGTEQRIARMRLLAPFGIARLLGSCLDDLDAPIANCGRYLRTVEAEFTSVVSSAHQVRDAYGKSLHPMPGGSRALGAKPLIVLTRDPSWGDVDSDTLKATWQVLQKELLQLSSNSRQEIAKSSGHYIHLSQPRLVIDSIRDVILASKSGQLLSDPILNSSAKSSDQSPSQ